MTAPTPSDDLQFSTAEPTAPLTPDSDASTGASCAQCAQPLRTHYYSVACRGMCDACKAGVERAFSIVISSIGGQCCRGSCTTLIARKFSDFSNQTVTILLRHSDVAH